MRHYESVFIMVPDLPDEERDQIVSRYRSVLTDNGAEMLNVDDWGRRRLAYEIKKQTKGHYVLFEHTAEPSAVAEMERQMRLDDQVIRFLTIKVADVFDQAAYESRKETGTSRKSQEESESGDEESRPRFGREAEDDEGDLDEGEDQEDEEDRDEEED